MRKILLYFVIVFAVVGCAKKQSAATDENAEITKIYNLVILDRSGSMMPLREVAVHGYNKTLDVIRNTQIQHDLEQQNFVTLTLFNHEITTVFDSDTVQNIPNLSRQEYQLSGNDCDVRARV